MDSHFNNYRVGGYVDVDELADVLTEIGTEIDLKAAYMAQMLHLNCSPDELDNYWKEKSGSDHPSDKLFIKALKMFHFDEHWIKAREADGNRWCAEIRKAARDHQWQCFDWHTFAPISPDSLRMCLDVRKVIGWLKSIGYPSWGIETLEEMLRESQLAHGEEVDDDQQGSQVGVGTEEIEQQIGARARNTMLRQMGALALLLAKQSTTFRNGSPDKPNVDRIAEWTNDLIRDVAQQAELNDKEISVHGLSVSNLSINISAGLALIFKSKS